MTFITLAFSIAIPCGNKNCHCGSKFAVMLLSFGYSRLQFF